VDAQGGTKENAGRHRNQHQPQHKPGAIGPQDLIMFRNCNCDITEVMKGHRSDCPLNKELAPHPVAPRKPFEEMDRDEMIIAHAELRASLSKYVKEFHVICRAAIQVVDWTEKTQPFALEMQLTRDKLMDIMDMHTKEPKP